jgi:hypothetical protein
MSNVSDDVMFFVALAVLLLAVVYEICRCCCKQLPDQRPDEVWPAPPPLVLRCFPYETTEGGGAASETSLCGICLDELRMGQLCSEVPACQHVFHRDCIGAWARGKGTCPLCRAVIVQGSDGVALADDMV